MDRISFDVRRGEIFGLLGPNGAGKSSVMKILSTLISMTAGEVSIMGFQRPANDNEIRDSIGYVPQDISADSSLTGYENILLSARLHGLSGKTLREKIGHSLRVFGLSDAKDRLTSTYSGGMIRRLELAQAFVHIPKVILMDEPTVGLDPIARNSILRQVVQLRKDFGATVIITTHYTQEADSICDRIAIMHRGRIAAIDSPERLKARAGKASVIFELENWKKAKLPNLRIRNGSATLATDNPESDMPRYVELLSSKGVIVKSAHIREMTLDDAFTRFTGGKLQDDDLGWRQAKKVRRVMKRVG